MFTPARGASATATAASASLQHSQQREAPNTAPHGASRYAVESVAAASGVCPDRGAYAAASRGGLAPPPRLSANSNGSSVSESDGGSSRRSSLGDDGGGRGASARLSASAAAAAAKGGGSAATGGGLGAEADDPNSLLHTPRYTINHGLLDDERHWTIEKLRWLCENVGISEKGNRLELLQRLQRWNRDPKIAAVRAQRLSVGGAEAAMAAPRRNSRSSTCNFFDLRMKRDTVARRYRHSTRKLPRKSRRFSILLQQGQQRGGSGGGGGGSGQAAGGQAAVRGGADCGSYRRGMNNLQQAAGGRCAPTGREIINQAAAAPIGKKDPRRIRFSPYNKVVNFDLENAERTEKRLAISMVANHSMDLMNVDPTTELEGDAAWIQAQRNLVLNLELTKPPPPAYWGP
eukprot:GHVU01025072.1.p1 GENE.GHVU01025072.1~~GHVU01025072.1.p1  ORF type:complete len:441 (+),score=105.90 GHVU01025072.1:116-1324(+)